MSAGFEPATDRGQFQMPTGGTSFICQELADANLDDKSSVSCSGGVSHPRRSLSAIRFVSLFGLQGRIHVGDILFVFFAGVVPEQEGQMAEDGKVLGQVDHHGRVWIVRGYGEAFVAFA